MDLKEYNRAEKKCRTYQKIVDYSHVDSQSGKHILSCSGTEEYAADILAPNSYVMPC